MVWFVVQVALTVLFAASTFALVFVLQYFAKRFIDEENHEGAKPRHVTRGQALVPLKKAEEDLEKNSLPADVDPRTYFFGGLWFGRSLETLNQAVFGVPESGKTLLAQINMNLALSRVRKPIGDETVGGIVVDYKREYIPVLASIVGLENVDILSPFDRRSVAPDLPAMFDTEARVHQLAKVQQPGNDKDSQPFWWKAAQDIMTALAMVFNERAPGRWELRDQLEASSSISRLTFVLKQSAQTHHLIESYLTTEGMTRSLIATIRSNNRDWRPVAAIWAKTPRKIHLGRFIEDLGRVLVLQPDVEKDLASKAVQRLVLRRCFEYGLMLPSSQKRRIFLFGDEIQELGRIDLLDSILATGRSRGWSCYLYTQTRDGMIAEYGEHVTAKMFDNIAHWACFATNDQTADWIARKFGKIEIKRMIDVVDPNDESKKSRSPQYQTTDALFSSELSSILPPSVARGLKGVYKTRLTRPFYSTVKGLDRLLPTPMPGVEAFEPRPSSDEVLAPWTMEDLRRLNLTVGPDDDLEAILGSTPPDTNADAPTPPTEAVEETSSPEAATAFFGKLLGRGRFGRKGGDK